MKTSRHEAGDRYMSGWVATCVHNGTRFFVNEAGAYTDCLSRAAWRRWASEADKLSQASSEPGFPMAAEPVAAVLSDLP